MSSPNASAAPVTPASPSSLDWLDWLVLLSFIPVTVVVSGGAWALATTLQAPTVLQILAALAAFSGSVATAWGYSRRSRLVFVGMLCFSPLLLLVLFLIGLPVAGLWWAAAIRGLLRARRVPQAVDPAPSPAAAPPVGLQVRGWDAASAKTEVFRPRPNDCEQTVLFVRHPQDELTLASPVLLAPAPLAPAPPVPAPAPSAPAPKLDDPTVPDQVDMICRWLLMAYAVFAGAAAIGALALGGWLVQQSLPHVEEQVVSWTEVLTGVLPILVMAAASFATSLACAALAWGLLARVRWTWALGVLLGVTMLLHGNLPMGALVLYALARERGRIGFGVQPQSQGSPKASLAA